MFSVNPVLLYLPNRRAKSPYRPLNALAAHGRYIILRNHDWQPARVGRVRVRREIEARDGPCDPGCGGGVNDVADHGIHLWAWSWAWHDRWQFQGESGVLRAVLCGK